MNHYLKKYFPMIRTRDEILDIIKSRPDLDTRFGTWSEHNREEFLAFCSGQRGVKMLYDSYFKEVMNPEYAPERLNEFLSLLLQQKVEVLHMMPNDGTRLADETSLLIMDIVVKLADGSISNIEVQKIGYSFPGERAACYSADLLLRQYKRIRDSSKQRKMNFRNIKTVYTIVLFENSPKMFHTFPEDYVHCFRQTSDTGLELDLVQKYVFVPLDIFRKNLHNRGIQSRLDAWLAFLAEDDPEWIARIITAYPSFKAMYETIYTMCLNVERVMAMFSEELRILDRNTVMYMIDEMQEEIDRKSKQLNQKDEQLNQKDEQLNQKDEQLNQKDEQLNQKDEQLNQKDEQLNQKDEQLNQKDEQLNQKDEQLNQKDEQLNQKEEELIRHRQRIEELQKKIEELTNQK